MDLWQPDVVIYHDNCMDGFTAAWCCKLRWRDAEFVARNYGQPVEMQVEGKRILIVDFSYPPSILIDLVEQGAHSIVLLDHHKTAAEQFQGQDLVKVHVDLPVELMPEYLGLCVAEGRPPILAIIDQDRSGAGMAWDFAHAMAGGERPQLVNLVEDRDLWRWRFGDDARMLHLALSSGERTFENWSAIAHDVPAAIDAGKMLKRYQDKLVEEICRRSYFSDVAGYRCIMVDCPYLLVSETGHKLLELHPQAPFAAMRVADDSSITFSLRSEDSRQDVSEVAGKFGGGGHRNAAGFRVPR